VPVAATLSSAGSDAVAARSPSRSSSEAVAARSPSRSSSEAVAARIRVRYAKTGKLRFISAIDLGRLWERALRKAGLPIAYSEGFSPHPKISFPDALPVGCASTGEYAELTFAAPVAVDAAIRDLNAAFVDGCEVWQAVPVVHGAPRLSTLLAASLWQIDYPPDTDPCDVDAAVAALRAAQRVVIARHRKSETVEADLRPFVYDLVGSGTCVRAVLLRSEPPVRAGELHAALAAFRPDAAGRQALPEPTRFTRVAQGAPAENGVDEALSGARVALGASGDP